MTQLIVRASMGSMSAWRELAPAFKRQTGHDLFVEQANSTALERGSIPTAPADLIVLYTDAIDAIIRQGMAIASSRTIFARAAVGLSVKAGAPRPDIGTPEAFKRTLLGAASICYSYGGSGKIAARAIETLGIAEQMRSRTIRSEGTPAAGYVARGEAEMAIQQVNVSKPVAGTDYVGDLPGDLHDYVEFAIAVTSESKQPALAGEVIRFVTSPQAEPLLRRGMMEPATA